ncbi:MAG TPA: hypothetical protein VED40_15635 [Azospirillaceae bacterium]|nr:hypothetical protein [Azospirillaceae bacterium]
MPITSVEADHASDGTSTVLTFTTPDGDVRLALDHTQWAPLLASLLGEMQTSARLRSESLRGADARSFYPVSPLNVAEISGAVTRDGTPILCLKLAGGAEIDLALDIGSATDLARGFARLAEGSLSRMPARVN